MIKMIIIATRIMVKNMNSRMVVEEMHPLL
jgi:hypothetical protein